MAKQPRTLWLPLWFTPRALYLLGAIAVLLACSPGLPPLAPVSLAAAIALSAAALLDVLIGPRADAIALARVLPEHFALRVPAVVAYEVANRSRLWVHVGILEPPMRTLRMDSDEASGDVPANSVAKISRSVTPMARGSDAFGTAYLWYENRLGLLRRRTRYVLPQTLRVYPDLSAVERYGKLHVRNRLIEAGLRKMRLRGQGTEFESLREWNDGDAFRTIDWKATARRGKVMVAQHEVERSQNVMLVLDCGRLMTPRLDEQRKLDYAITAALSVAAIAGLASDKVGLIAFAGEILTARAPRATRSSLAELSDVAYDLEPRFEEADYARAFAYLRTHLNKRSLVVMFTDVVDPVAQSTVLGEIGSLARRHVVVCVFMNDAAVENALAVEPRSAAEAYRTSVALDLSQERRVAIATLERLGVHVIDVPAKKMSVVLIDEYLRIKQRGLI